MRKIVSASLLIFVSSFSFLIQCCSSEVPCSAIDIDNMSLTMKPGDDFYRYVNGHYIDTLTIPDDKSVYDAIAILREEGDERIHMLLKEMANITDAEKGSDIQKIADFYSAGMDTKSIEADGIIPLQPEFELIERIKTQEDLQNVVARFHTYGLDILFCGDVEIDMMNSSHYMLYLWQAGIGLPDRDYYTSDDERSKKTREEYVKHLERMFTLLGDDSSTAAKNARDVMSIETGLAEASKTNLEMRDIQKGYNLMDIATLAKHAPHFDWERYFGTISDIDITSVVVVSPEFIKKVSDLIVEVPLEQWKAYLRWNLINHSAPYLNDAFVMEDYTFFSDFLSGNEKIQDRWKRVTQATNNFLGQLVGKIYVERYFPAQSKAMMVALTDNLKKALEKRIGNLHWMGKETKAAALEKLSHMRIRVGYPDRWDDFSALEIKRDSYIKNVWRVCRFQYYKNLNKLREPVDKDEWGLNPQTVNACYNPLRNDITFPAGILQQPIFNPDADDAVNYGSIGVVIGHEMTHGFDDQGRLFDGNGTMRDWWTEKDAEEFEKRASLLVDQYDNFVAVDGVKINGRLTLGENIADFGGLTIALEAYKISREGKPQPHDRDGFTDLQRFFIGYGQIWRGKIRDQALKRKCQEDVHPWNEFRVNGALFNVPEFYQNFMITPKDRYYRSPEQRPVIW